MNSSVRVSFLSLLLIALGFLGLAGRSAELTTAQVARVTGRHFQVGVDKTSGQVVELIDVASQHNFASAATNLGGLWELDLANAGTLTPANARQFDVAPSTASALRLRWSEFGLVRAPQLNVEVTVRVDPNQALSHWQIQVNHTGGPPPRLIRFPRLLNIPEQPREHLAVPVWLGQQAENPRALLRGENSAPKRWEWSYPGLLSMQCLALTSDGGMGFGPTKTPRALP